MLCLTFLYFFLGIQRVLSGSSFRRSLLCFFSRLSLFNFQSPWLLSFRTAYTVYHKLFRLSSTFQNFFQLSFRHSCVSLYSLSQSLSYLSDLLVLRFRGASVYHTSFRLSRGFWNFLFDILVFPKSVPFTLFRVFSSLLLRSFYILSHHPLPVNTFFEIFFIFLFGANRSLTTCISYHFSYHSVNRFLT